ncbi:MAG: GTPase Era [Verrucomicrobiota bacterium]
MSRSAPTNSTNENQVIPGTELTLEDLNRPWPSGKVGYVALLGRPNVGKSTLLNSILDHHLAAVSAKPQTTRRRWLGIYCEEDCQLLFLDTPGVHQPKLVLGEAMQGAITQAIRDADVLVILVDALRRQGEEDGLVAERAAAAARIPALLTINKCDEATDEQIAAAEQFYRKRLGKEIPALHVSGCDRSTLDELLQGIRDRLPEGPFLYDPEELTDASVRELGADLIREVVMNVLRQEVPHATAVTIEQWDEGAKPPLVQATLHVERDSQKGIVVGQGGQTIGQIRREAEALLSDTFGPVKLKLWVKVSKDWRKRRGFVRDLMG